MHKLLKSDFVYNFLILFIPMLGAEMIFRLISGAELLDFAVLRIVLGLVILSLVVGGLISLVKHVISNVLAGIFVFVASFYIFLQAGFHNFLGVYISFKTSSQLGAVTSYIKDFFASFHFVYLTIFIPFILLIVFLILSRKKINVIRVRKRLGVLWVLLLTIIFGVFYMATIKLSFFESKYQSVSNEELFLTASNPTIVVDQYGVLGFFILDVKSIVYPVTIAEEYESDENNEQIINENSRLFDDRAWELLLEEETNKEYSSIDKYLLNRPISDKNEYTGLFEDKNLIVLMLESVNDIFINPELYPNFYKMLSNGWYFENNYSPRNSCATMNNEFSGMTSLYSIYNTCTASTYKDNKYSESIFNIFNDIGYTTFSAHNYTQAYYPRKAIHTSMGSKEYYGVEKLGIPYSNEYINWSNDDEFLDKVLDIIDDKLSSSEHFMTWLTTVSSHQPYSVNSIQGDKYYNLTKGTKYPTDVRRYMSKLKILDNALGVLLEGLEEKGILDDTVIVLYGDHYPYGISNKNLNKVLPYDTAEDMNAERVPLVIYNSELEGQVFSQYTTYINILPTIANLFGLDYDPRLYIGTDLFDENYQSLAVFADGSWKNEHAYYDAAKMKVKYYSSFTYSEEEIKKINDDIADYVSVSNKIITSGYFERLEKKLPKYEEKVKELEETMCPLEEVV